MTGNGEEHLGVNATEHNPSFTSRACTSPVDEGNAVLHHLITVRRVQSNGRSNLS
jgi:hypothetical protein